MDTVGNQADGHAVVTQRHPERAGLSMVQTTGRVERMGEEPRTGIDRAFGLRGRRRRVTERNPDAALGQQTNCVGGALALRADGHQPDRRWEGGEPTHVHLCRSDAGMGPSGAAEERPFEMQSQGIGPCRTGESPGEVRDPGVQHVERSGDESRQP